MHHEQLATGMPSATADTSLCCREDAFNRELSELQQRCQQAEARHEQLAAEMPSATAPLLRQLEAMQHSAQQHAAAWAAAEAHLMQRVSDADAAAATSSELSFQGIFLIMQLCSTAHSSTQLPGPQQRRTSCSGSRTPMRLLPLPVSPAFCTQNG